MNPVYKSAGERIYMMRLMRGFTREDLAEKASISSKFLYEIEAGRKGFSANVLYNICSALNVDCDYILTGKEKSDYSQNLLEVTQLFTTAQTKRLEVILKEIAELLKKE